MADVQVTIMVPSAEKDLVDALIIAIKDLKANKGSSLIQDELPSIMKLMGEMSELMSELKSKNSMNAIVYLGQQIAEVLV